MAKKNLTEGNIGKQLVELTIPMIFGILGIVIFNLVDTYFVGKLGVEQLAAMSFTFPVIMVLNSLAQAIGIGASLLVARSIIGINREEMKKMVSRAILLGVLIVVVFMLVAIIFMKKIFILLGAEGIILNYIMQYMNMWVIGMPFLVIPMIGNNIIGATGDTLTPGVNMLINGTVNAVLDPLFIFGLYGFPEMGMAGAALATIIGRATGFVVVLTLLMFREKMITIKIGKINEIVETWKEILHTAIPTSLTMLIPPISMALITRILSDFGKETVAAFGVATRIEMFGMIVVMALSSVLIIFVGQNISQSKFERINLALKKSYKFAIMWGILFFASLLLFEKQIAGLFTNNAKVIEITQIYFYIVGGTYGLQALLSVCSSSFNGLNKPISSAILSIIRMIILYLPLAWLGAKYFQEKGVFWAGGISNIISGIIAVIALTVTLRKIEQKLMV